MPTATYALGRPFAADQRGGDCRARDLHQERNVHGEHRFATTTHAQITNGMLRVTVGATGVAPTLTIEALRGRITVGDVYEDVYTDLYGGEITPLTWLSMGTVTIDSSALSALLTRVRLERITPEAVTIRLVAPLMADAFVTLKRGRRHIDIQHGSSRAPRVATSRRVTWNGLTGTVSANRVEESTAGVGLDGMFRFVASLDTVTANAAAFSLTTPSVTTTRFGVGVGTDVFRDRASDMHLQMADATRTRVVVS